jgi:serine/threonine protein kinase
MQSSEWITINDREYRVGAVLSTGAGSYGQVWAATDPEGRAVALKLINTEAMSQADPALRGHWRDHLEREIAFLDRLNADESRHVVALFDHGLVDDQPVLVLERLQANLGQWLAQQQRQHAPPDLTQILDWAEQIVDGLDVVHGAGFVYRDLKFSNLLVGENGALLKLADFGSLRRENGDNTRSFIGTPATMAPEQALPDCRGADGYEYAVDYRADYYALGLLLFTLLTDRPTTAAQRRLGQLLTLHGQQGAAQHQAQLGGLDEEEREALQRSIEFWTMPITPETAQGGAATRLTDLIVRLLAADCRERPVDSQEIRTVLDAVRTDQPDPLLLTPDWDTLPPPAELLNRPLHRSERRPPALPRRWALLAAVIALVGAATWAMIRPGVELRLDQAASLNVAATPPLADAVTRPVAPMQSIPPESPAAPAVEHPEPAAATETVPETASIQVAPVAPDRQPEIPLEQESEPPAVVTTPPAPDREAVKPVAPLRPKTPVTGKAKADKPRLMAPERPAVVNAPVAEDRRPNPPPRIVKPAPKPAAPAARMAPSVARRAPPVPKSPPVARVNPALAPMARTPAAVPPVAKPEPVTRVEPPSRPTPPSLPPIKLVSKSSDPRVTPTPAAQPVAVMSRVTPVSPPGRQTPSIPAPARSADPIQQFQYDAGRAASDVRRQAESFTRWINRASATTGAEIRRSLETVDQNMGRWTGSCNRAGGCNSTVPVERRDRWYRRYGGGIAIQREP